MNQDRAAMLLAFHEDSEILTKRQIMARAFVQNTHIFISLLESQLITALPWRPGDTPRDYVLTPKGREWREREDMRM